ncbi:MAG: hypothetical protein RR576_03555 [Oscillospiraceae bacterium]
MNRTLSLCTLLVLLLLCFTSCTKGTDSASVSSAPPLPKELVLTDITKENSVFKTDFRTVSFLDVPTCDEQILAANYLLAMARGDVALKSFKLGENAVYPYIGHSMYSTFDVTELTTLTENELNAEYLYNEPLTHSSLTPFASGIDAYIKEKNIIDAKIMRVGYRFTYTSEGDGIEYLRPVGSYTMYILLGKNDNGQYRIAATSSKLLDFTPGKKEIPISQISIVPKGSNKAEQEIIDYYTSMAHKTDTTGYPIYLTFSLDEVKPLTDKDILRERYFRQDLDVAPIFGYGLTYEQFCEKSGLLSPVMIKATFTYSYTDKAIMKGGQYPDGTQKQYFIANQDENGELAIIGISKL